MTTPIPADSLLAEADAVLAALIPPARRDPSISAAVGADAIARTDGPGFTLPPIPTVPSFDNGTRFAAQP